jgi:hypothetical protein
MLAQAAGQPGLLGVASVGMREQRSGAAAAAAAAAAAEAEAQHT